MRTLKGISSLYLLHFECTLSLENIFSSKDIAQNITLLALEFNQTTS